MRASGFAPFRGFLQERERRASAAGAVPLGPLVFIFGCRSPDELIYKGEIDMLIASRVISDPIFAYSRFGKTRCYVQDAVRLPSVAARLTVVLSHPKAQVYVCGTATMAHAVETAITETGAAEVTGMRAQNRYHEDIFGERS